MHERVARHGGRRGEYERQCDPQDRRAQCRKQNRQNAERWNRRQRQGDDSGSDPSRAGAIGSVRRQYEMNRQRVNRQRVGEDDIMPISMMVTTISAIMRASLLDYGDPARDDAPDRSFRRRSSRRGASVRGVGAELVFCLEMEVAFHGQAELANVFNLR